MASDTLLVFLHPNFRIWCLFFYLSDSHTTKNPLILVVHLIQKGQGHFFACEFPAERSSSADEFSIFLREVKQKMEVLPSTSSAVGAQCVLPGNEDENGTQDLQKGCFVPYSGSPFVCLRCIMLEC